MGLLEHVKFRVSPSKMSWDRYLALRLLWYVQINKETSTVCIFILQSALWAPHGLIHTARNPSITDYLFSLQYLCTHIIFKAVMTWNKDCNKIKDLVPSYWTHQLLFFVSETQFVPTFTSTFKVKYTLHTCLTNSCLFSVKTSPGPAIKYENRRRQGTAGFHTITWIS